MEGKLNVLTAATQLQTLVLQHRTASRQIQCLDDYIGGLGGQMLRAEMGGREGDTLHLCLRVSAAEGVASMYRAYSGRVWGRVQQLARAVVEGEGGADDIAMEVDGETGQMGERVSGDRRPSTGHSTLDSSYEAMSTSYITDSSTNTALAWSGQSSMDGQQGPESTSSVRTRHRTRTSPVWQDQSTQSSPVQTRPRSDKAAARWTNYTRVSQRAG